jgi:hypothetical protein
VKVVTNEFRVLVVIAALLEMEAVSLTYVQIVYHYASKLG